MHQERVAGLEALTKLAEAEEALRQDKRGYIAAVRLLAEKGATEALKRTIDSEKAGDLDELIAARIDAAKYERWQKADDAELLCCYRKEIAAELMPADEMRRLWAEHLPWNRRLTRHRRLARLFIASRRRHRWKRLRRLPKLRRPSNRLRRLRHRWMSPRRSLRHRLLLRTAIRARRVPL